MSEPISEKPRRWRFGVSLRMMMVLILAIGCGLGWRVRRAESQRRAVAQAGKLGAMIQYDYQYSGGKSIPTGEPWGPSWLRKALGNEYFQEVSSVKLYTFAAPKKDVDLAPIEQFDRLEAFETYGDGITDAEIIAHIEDRAAPVSLMSRSMMRRSRMPAWPT